MQLYNVCHVCTVNAKYARLGFFFFFLGLCRWLKKNRLDQTTPSENAMSIES